MQPVTNVDRVSTFKIFVKNLPDNSTQEELKAIFEEYGRVVECEIFRKIFAFVHMEDVISGRLAISVLNGRSFKGNAISVVESHLVDLGPKIPTTRLLVKNIPSSLKAVELRSLFKKYGMVLSAEISDGTGIVHLEAMGDLRTAVREVNGFVYDGCSLIVEPMANTAETFTPRKTQPVQKKTMNSLMDLPRDGAAQQAQLMPLIKLPPSSRRQRPVPLLQDLPIGPHGLMFNNHNQQNPTYYDEMTDYETNGNDSNYYEEMQNPETDYDFNYEEPHNPEAGDYYESEYSQIQDASKFDRVPSHSWQSFEPEHRVLRDPFGPDSLPLFQKHGVSRPPQIHGIPRQSQQNSMPLLRQRNPLPLMGSMGMPVSFPRNTGPFLARSMQQAVRPHFSPRLSMAPIRNPTAYVDIEPLFLRRHELLNEVHDPRSVQNEEFYEYGLQQFPNEYQQGRTPNGRHFHQRNPRPPPLIQEFYNGEPSQPRSRYPQEIRPRAIAGLHNTNSRPPPLLDEFYRDEPIEPLDPQWQFQHERSSENNSVFRNNSKPPPLFKQPFQMPARYPPPLFQGNRIKRSVPSVDPGQPFQVPGMIPPGTFQPPRKFHSNRPKAPAKKKIKTEPAYQPPIPEEPQRPVPDFSMESRFPPRGSVLRAFPPPLMNQNIDFSEDPDLNF